MKRKSGVDKKREGLGIVAETLTEDNYEHWKRCLKNYLVGHGLWAVVAGKEEEPDKSNKQQHEEWKKKNALALHAIQLSCGAEVYTKVSKAHMSAHEAWNRLAHKSDHEENHDHHHVEHNGTQEYLKYERLYQAIEEGNLKETQKLIEETPNAVNARISSHKDTALHIALLSGHTGIASYLVSRMKHDDLELINEYGATALSLAAISGAKKLAREIVRKNKNLVRIGNEHEDGHLPVIVAALYGQKRMVRYLYKLTHKSELSPEKGKNGVMLLNCLITAEIYDVASMLLKQYPKLGVMSDSDQNGHYALKILSHKPSAFPTGTKLTFWEKWIYKCVIIHSPWEGVDWSHNGEHIETQTMNEQSHVIDIHESSEDEEIEGSERGSSGVDKKREGFGIVAETLTEDNYEHWKRCLKNYLVGHGLWAVVAGKEEEPDKSNKQQHEEWKKKNALALHAIQLSCGAEVYTKVSKAHMSAHEAWNRLAHKSDHEENHDHQHVEHNGTQEYLKYERLYQAIEEGNLKETQKLIEETPNAVNARISSHKDTALHIALLSGHTGIASYLVSRMKHDDLELINEYGATALSLAAISGAKKLAREIVRKNKNLVRIGNEHEDGHLPVIVAALYGQKRMVRYLYKLTHKSELSPEKGKNGVMLLNCLITAEIYDVASMLLKQYPKLGVMSDSDQNGHYALKILSHKPSAFPTGTKLTFWEKWIYKCVIIHSPWEGVDWSHNGEHIETQTMNEQSHVIDIHESSEDEEIEGSERGSSGYHVLRKLGRGLLIMLDLKHIHHRKLVHDESVKLLRCMFREMRTLNDKRLEEMDIDTIIYDAIKHGIVEFVREMLIYKPGIIWKKDKKGRTIFSHSIVLRQEKIFNLIYDLGTKKNIMTRRVDIFGNNYLHLAAKLSPPSQLERVSGAALQMQRELQWYKEVESLVQPKLKEEVNENNKTPAVLFSDEHKGLIKDAESWMKSTAGSSMIVGTLIAAVMFTTAFTVPGGNKNDNGMPVMLDKQPRAFLIFMVSNALSMFTSCTSLLMFLGILTARYAEEDFLKLLPTKLIFALACLFLSIVTLMSSFGSALYLVLHEKLAWVTIPIIILSVIPIAIFSLCQFPLLIEMVNRTYGSGIFHKRKKSSIRCFS